MKLKELIRESHYFLSLVDDNSKIEKVIGKFNTEEEADEFGEKIKTKYPHREFIIQLSKISSEDQYKKWFNSH